MNGLEWIVRIAAGLGGGAVCGIDVDLIGHAVLLEFVNGFLHDGQVAVAAHNNRNFFHCPVLLADVNKQDSCMFITPSDAESIHECC